jgi:hypothetical protein
LVAQLLALGLAVGHVRGRGHGSFLSLLGYGISDCQNAFGEA